MNRCSIKWHKVMWCVWGALVLLLGVMLLGGSSRQAIPDSEIQALSRDLSDLDSVILGATSTTTFRLPTNDGLGVEVILPADVPVDLDSRYMQVICSGSQNLCVLRFFYAPDKNFNSNPYLHFYDFVVIGDKKVVLGLIQYLDGEERYWKYETSHPEELSLKEFKEFVAMMLTIDASVQEG